jgi:hypothetical protein
MKIFKYVFIIIISIILTSCSKNIDKTPEYLSNKEFKNSIYLNSNSLNPNKNIDFSRTTFLDKESFLDNKKNHFRKKEYQNDDSIIEKEEFKNKNIVKFDKNQYNSIDFSTIEKKSIFEQRYENDKNTKKYLLNEDFYYNKNQDINFDNSKIYDDKYFSEIRKNNKFDKDTNNFMDNVINILSVPFRLTEFLFLPFNKLIDTKYEEKVNKEIKPIDVEKF